MAADPLNSPMVHLQDAKRRFQGRSSTVQCVFVVHHRQFLHRLEAARTSYGILSLQMVGGGLKYVTQEQDATSPIDSGSQL
jgi:hypothetical protein